MKSNGGIVGVVRNRSVHYIFAGNPNGRKPSSELSGELEGRGFDTSRR
jgi:hypothetical protein